MIAIASQIILCLVLAALIGLIIGYLLGRSNCPKNTYRTEPLPDSHVGNDTEGSHTPTKSYNKKKTNAAAVAHEKSKTETAASVKSDKKSEEGARDKKVKEPNAPRTKDAIKTAVDNKKGAKVSEASAATAEVSDETSDSKSTKALPQSQNNEPVSPSDDDKPASLLSAPRDGKKDNLTRIKGIGVKIEELLNETGVFHFDQIAAWSEKEANWIDHKVSFPGRAKRDDWIGQAKLLAAGKETEFSKRVDAGKVSSSKQS